VQGLGGMYGGYLAAGKLPIRVFSSPRLLKRMRDIFSMKLTGTGIFMTLDCYARLDQTIAKLHRGLKPVTKKEL
jgi:hypothetical protein